MTTKWDGDKSGHKEKAEKGVKRREVGLLCVEFEHVVILKCQDAVKDNGPDQSIKVSCQVCLENGKMKGYHGEIKLS